MTAIRIFLISLFSCVTYILHAQQASGADTLVAINVSSLNSSAGDIFPFLPDENTIYLSRHEINANAPQGDPSRTTDKIWTSVRISDSAWSSPTPVASMDKLGSVGALIADSLGDIFFASTYGKTDPKSPNDMDLFSLINGKVLNLGAPINTTRWESQPSITPDGNDLYFASNQSGSIRRNVEIYVTHRTKEGKWSQPSGLGPKINSKGNSSCPFITRDRKTLLFASENTNVYGQKIGSMKIYLSRKTGSGDMDWSDPIELPYPINTSDNSLSPCLSPDNHELYFSSDRSGGKGMYDIYLVRLPHGIDDLLPKAKQ